MCVPQRRLLEGVAALRKAGRHVIVCVDRGPQTERLEFNATERRFGLRPSTYDRYSGLYCDHERLITSRPEEVPTADHPKAQGTQIVFHQTPVDYAPATFPMHGILYVQEAVDPNTTIDQLIAEGAVQLLLDSSSFS